MARSKASSKGSRLGNMEAVAAATLEQARLILKRFAPVFRSMRTRRDNLVTPELYKEYQAVYAAHAWIAVPEAYQTKGQPVDMFRFLLKLDPDESNTNPLLVAEKNFSAWVRKGSPVALAAQGKAPRKQTKAPRKAKPLTLEDVKVYVKALPKTFKPGKADAALVAEIYGMVHAWMLTFKTKATKRPTVKPSLPVNVPVAPVVDVQQAA